MKERKKRGNGIKFCQLGFFYDQTQSEIPRLPAAAELPADSSPGHTETYGEEGREGGWERARSGSGTSSFLIPAVAQNADACLSKVNI